MRWLLLFHRYTGIGLCLLMLLWCLSGIVMIYVPYPSLPEADRLTGLAPLDEASCCAVLRAIKAPFTIEMLAGRAVVRTAHALFDLRRGEPIAHVTDTEALAAAQNFAQGHGLESTKLFAQLIAYDPWTVEKRRSGPFYRITLNDAAGTVLYVAKRDGLLVQRTTHVQRVWNNIGAIPHWLYIVRLRQNTVLWAQVIIWTSLAGSVLVLAGLVIGSRACLRALRNGRWSPYRGATLWHHLPGLIFGLFLLSWTVSGCLSMNPFGLLEGGRDNLGQRLAGLAPAASQLKLPAALLQNHRVVSLSVSPLLGQLYILVHEKDGRTLRLDADGHAAPMDRATLERIASALKGRGEMLTQGDDYYFSYDNEAAPLPVYRVLTADGARLYLSPDSGALLRHYDRADQGYRWWFQGLHRLDFTAALRTRPLWDILMLALLTGASAIAATGCYLAARVIWRGVRYFEISATGRR